MSKRSIVLYLHAHQPWRVRDYTIFDTANDHQYFNQSDDTERNNRKVFDKVAAKSYLPMNALLEKLLHKHPDFKVSFSLSGTFLEQAELWAPEVIESFQRLVATGQVELVAETYYHSLAFFYDRKEFEDQVRQHQAILQRLFGVMPTAFRNTELAYNNELAGWAEEAGFKAILAEGWDPILEWRSPNHVYRPSGTTDMKLLLKNYRLSDDLAFRFSDRNWVDYPLSTDKYVHWLNQATKDSDLINLFMDYETFGEHQWADSGIFEFFEHMVDAWLDMPDTSFATVSEAADRPSVGDISMPETVTWADNERDLSAWLGNSMQREANRHLYALGNDILRTGDQDLIDDWRRLQTSDHVYYMCTKWFRDGDVHAYFSPYSSPYEAFLAYMNVLRDMRYRLMSQQGGWYV